MKKLIYIFVSLILLSSLFPTLNYSAPSGALEIVLENPHASETHLLEARKVLINRLEAYGLNGFAVEVKAAAHQLVVTLPDAAAQEPLLPLLIARGELRFSETFDRQEIARMLEGSPYRQQWQQWLTVDAGSLGQQGKNVVLAELHREAITSFNRFLEEPEKREGLPSNLYFALGRFPTIEDLVEVFALRYDPDGASAPAGKSVREAVVQTNEATGEISISLTFFPEGAQEWAAFTRRNIGRAVAIVIDDMVYFAPRVAAEITAGKAMVTGRFNGLEAKTLAAIIQGGMLPVDLELVE